ncbi:MAG: mucoidy inhibitor MuiA family protein [Fimbriimonadaceae bacterium]|nr:mucoidy inhibitor MuiA family protein [Fimbriimonadaceae bacterium]
MNLRRSLRPVIAAGLLALPAAHAQTSGQVIAVRAYRGQALVTRAVPVQAVAGAQELVVSGLPEQVQPSSLYATGDENLSIRAVRYRQDAVREEPREEVRALDAQIATKQDALGELESQIKVLEQHSKYLDKLETWVAPTATTEMSKGVLDPETIIKLTAHALEQRTKLAADQLRLGREKKAVTEELSVLQRQRTQLAGQDSKTRREAVVFLEARQAGAASIELNYLVGGVNWTPAYVARLGAKHDKLALEYHGVVTQASGEDWKDVALTLSTSFATMQADAPVLAPLYVGLREAAEADEPAKAGADYGEQRRALEKQLYERQANDKPAEPPRPTASSGGAPGAPGPRVTVPRPETNADLAQVNILAAQLQQLELAASDDAVRVARRAGSKTEGLAVDYELPGKVSVQARLDQQIFRIAALDLKPQTYYTAVPIFSDYVYQAVATTNTSGLALLPGPYNAYIEGAFAGQGQLPMTADGQALTLGFGTESRLKVTRELEEKKTDLRGGNKQVRFNYRFRVQNFLDRPAVVRIWDRLPQTPGEQVAVTLLEGPKLSDDPLYQDLEKPRGLLRWDTEVAAGAAGVQAKGFVYSFQMEFDKNYAVGALAADLEEQMLRDIERLKEGRSR